MKECAVFHHVLVGLVDVLTECSVHVTVEIFQNQPEIHDPQRIKSTDL